MNPLIQLKELKEVYRNQNFYFNEGQQKTYDNLLQQRRERVKYFYENDLVCKGGKKKVK
jgi:hypothetical protein